MISAAASSARASGLSPWRRSKNHPGHECLLVKDKLTEVVVRGEQDCAALERFPEHGTVGDARPGLTDRDDFEAHVAQPCDHQSWDVLVSDEGKHLGRPRNWKHELRVQ